MLEPELPQYRVSFDRVSRHRWHVVGAFAAGMVIWAALAPVRLIESSIPWIFGSFALALVGIEVRLFLIFREDLMARKRIAESDTVD